jgi:adenine-specific DNA-methyltransferase
VTAIHGLLGLEASVKPTPTDNKLRGGYYTPPDVARFLVKWAVQSPSCSILEPSCGDGVILQAAAEVLTERGATADEAARQIYAVEVQPAEANKAGNRLSQMGVHLPPDHIHSGDFFAYCEEHLSRGPLLGPGLAKRTFDAVIGNPPFIRYQNFDREHQAIAFRLMRSAGLHPNRLTNTWAAFLVASTLLLGKHGRLAMVIPAELLQVNYASEIRAFLCQRYGQITIVTFRELLFDGIQQEIVLVLGSVDGSHSHGIRTLELGSARDLSTYDQSHLSGLELKPMSAPSDKWTRYFLSGREMGLIDSLKSDPRLTVSGDVLDVDVGIVTGENSFFLLSERKTRDWSLRDHVQPIVSRSSHLKGITFTQSDWSAHSREQAPVYLLLPPDDDFESLPAPLKSYIKNGESLGVHTGYKCRIRDPWYRVRSVWSPDAFMLRQVHAYPKLVLNKTRATSTDTVHRVRFKTDTNTSTVACAFINSLTFAFTELVGRSYGGGVLTFEPSEAERMPLPLVGAEALEVPAIDGLMRQGRIEDALDRNDEALLVRGLGLTPDDVATLRGVWTKLRDRRINRNHPTRSRRPGHRVTS